MDGLPCIKCGEMGNVKVSLDDGDTMTCGGCEAEFTTADVQSLLDAWKPVLKWLEAHPARTPEVAGV